MLNGYAASSVPAGEEPFVIRDASPAAVLVFLTLLGPSGASADSPFRYSGTRVLSMGGAFTAVADDENALYWNPAGLAATSAPLAAVSGRMQRYPMEGQNQLIGGELTYLNREIAASFAHRGFGASVHYSGRGWEDELNVACGGESPFANMRKIQYIFDTWTVSLSYGRAIVRRVSLGAAARYLHFSKPYEEACKASYQGENGFALDLGILFRLSPKLAVGLTVDNVAAGRFDYVVQNPFGPGAHVEGLPIETNVGIAYRPIEALLLAADVHNVFEDGVRATYCNDEFACKRSFHAGCEWRGPASLRLRTGYLRDARTFEQPCQWWSDFEYEWYDNVTAGLGWSNGRLSIDLGAWWDNRTSKIEELPWRVGNTTVSGSASISVAF